MPNMLISINYRRPIGPLQWTQIEGVRNVVKFLEGAISGHVESDDMKFLYNDSIVPNSFASYAGQAAALLVASTASGAVGGVIGGTTVTTVAAGGDTVTMTALVAAIKANATVGQFVTATSNLASLTTTSVVAGTTVSIWNQTFTAIANGATPKNFGEFSIGASDTACSLALANAINQHPSLTGRITAVSVVGAVFIGKVDNGTPRPVERITNPLTAAGATATTIVATAPVCVAGARCMVFASVPGVIGNFVTLTASGTGMTAATNGTAGQLGGGSGGGVPAFTSDVVL